MSPHARSSGSETIETILHDVYADICAYGLSSEACTDAGITSSDFVYGEVPASVLKMLLERCPLHPGGTFMDLGSGAGHLVLSAALLGRFEEVRGVELLAPLHNAARLAQTRLRQKVAQLPRITLTHADLRAVSLHDCDFVITYSTCFTVELVCALEQMCQRCRPGTQLVTFTHALRSRRLRLVEAIPVSIEGGIYTAFRHEVRTRRELQMLHLNENQNEEKRVASSVR